MLRRYVFALRPGWIVLHVFTVAAVVAMILLGRWQWDVSQRKHFDLQNFGYSIQWWLFSAFALFLWWRIVRDAARRRAGEATGTTLAEPARQPEEPVTYRRYVMPATPQTTDDPALAAYNEYLAGLAAKDPKDAG